MRDSRHSEPASMASPEAHVVSIVDAARVVPLNTDAAQDTFQTSAGSCTGLGSYSGVPQSRVRAD